MEGIDDTLLNWGEDMLFLRPCNENDIHSAAQLMCWVYNEPPKDENWSLDRAEKRVAALLSGTSAYGWAMIVEREVVGYMFGRIDIAVTDSIFYVNEMYVNPRYQRSGCGSIALGQVSEILKKDGVTKIKLHTDSEDTSFYEKNGFEKSSYSYLEKAI